MPITHTKTGATIFTEEGITYYRLRMLVSALKLEMKGIVVFRGGRTAYAVLKRDLGLKGSRAKVLAQAEAIAEEEAARQIHIVEEP